MIDRSDAVADKANAGAPADAFAIERLARADKQARSDSSQNYSSTQLDILFGKIDNLEKQQNPVDRASDKPFQRFETNNVLEAVKLAQKEGLPLVVQVGASWCPHCQNMEKLWPKVEGSPTEKGSMQGKAIFLHLDWDESKNLTGTNAQLAEIIKDGVKGFPTFKVFSIDAQNEISLNAMSVGELSQTQLEAVIVRGSAKK